MGRTIDFETDEELFSYLFTDARNGTFLVTLQIGNEIVDSGVALPAE